MCCNKNLTDDQLEAMFTVTDEEMEQTEQPMECLTERNKHQFTTVNLKSKRRNAPAVVKPSVVLIIC